VTRIALALVAACAVGFAVCGQDASTARAAEPSVAGADAPSPVDVGGRVGEPGEQSGAPGRLELAVLAPLPEFVDDGPAAPPPGHLVAHGSIDEWAPPQTVGTVHLTWSQLDAPDYVEPALMLDDERPSLSEVLAPRVVEASGHRVVIDGFGTVEREEHGRPRDLLLTPLPPACCLGRFPGATERVHVRLPAGSDLELDPWTPLRLVGTLAVEERRDGLGLFEGLYFLRVEG